MRGRPIRPAYTDTNSLSVACPNCEGEVGQWCVRDDGSSRRSPCVARIVLASGVIVPAAPGHNYARDFSEPCRGNPLEEDDSDG